MNLLKRRQTAYQVPPENSPRPSENHSQSVLKNPVAVNMPFVADCEQTRQRVIGGSNGVDTSENVDYLYYVGT